MTEPNIDIIDFQSEDRSEQHPASEIRPVPKAIKLLIGGIALALVLGAVALYAFNIKTATQKTSTVDMDGDAMVVGGGDIDGDQTFGGNEMETQLDAAVAKTRANARPPIQQKRDEQIGNIKSQIEIMTQQINDLMAQNNTALEQLNTQVSQNTQILKTALTQTDLNEIKLDLNDIQHRAELIKAASEKPLKKIITNKKKFKKRITVRPRNMPFKLITIDQWGGVNYAAIESREMTGIENLRTGDRLSGWQVETIDAEASTVQFKNVKTGYTIKQNTR